MAPSHTDHESESSSERLRTLVDRLSKKYADDLRDDDADVEYEMYVDEWNAPDSLYRVRIRPARLEDGSWQRDLGPAYKDADKMIAFLEGLDHAGDIARYASE